ncbi:hypothetical protein CYY_008319 [Polysphondylium violaceum]|uniref:Calcium load-activated calcium channel n=1 Tax=Polysphondylium violaceum TaxID=133409 RepID=A0A8J4UXE1_9MYCE|nr:hypothetical protein CYY_008319 [Polysphondylium violaceum]
MTSDILFIIFVSIASSLASEAFSWVLVYRTDSYKKSKQTIERLEAQIEKLKEAESSASILKKGKDKRLERAEEALKAANKDLSFSKMKSMFAVAVSMIALFSYLNKGFDGKIVAKLPFEPIGFIQGLSHRNIEGNDMTDCAMTFLYVLCSMGLRNNIQIILGTEPPKTKNANPFLESLEKNK